MQTYNPIPSIADLPAEIQQKIAEFNARPNRRTEAGRPPDDRVLGWSYIEPNG